MDWIALVPSDGLIMSSNWRPQIPGPTSSFCQANHLKFLNTFSKLKISILATPVQNPHTMQLNWLSIAEVRRRSGADSRLDRIHQWSLDSRRYDTRNSCELPLHSGLVIIRSLLLELSDASPEHRRSIAA